MAAIAVAAAIAVGAVALTVDLGSGSAESSGPIVVEQGLVGQPAPAFDLERLDGGRVRLADFDGRPLIVNFWASWCGPCKDEFPIFRAARERHAADGLEILGVIHDDGPEAARAFAESQDAEWPMLLDPDDAAYNAYRVLALPTTFYVDRDGIVRAVSFGPPPSGVLDEQLHKILEAG